MVDRTRVEPRQRATATSRRRNLARIIPGTPPGTLHPPEPGAVAAKRVSVIAYTHDAVTETEGKTLEETLFIPLTLIASIYGMNFEHIPELHWRWGYEYGLGLMAITAIGMLLYFRRKGWW